MTVIPEEVLRVKYLGNNACGFIKNHEYLIKVDKNCYSYIVHGIEDLTTGDDEIDIYICISSEISFNHNFKIINNNGESEGKTIG